MNQAEDQFPHQASRSRKTVRNISIAMGILVVAFSVLLATRKPVDMQTVASPLLNKPAPAPPDW